MAAMIIMISSNEGATGVNAARLFPLTQPVITTFRLSLWLTHVLHHVILSQSQPCHAALSPACHCWQGRPKNRRGKAQRSRPHYDTAGVGGTADGGLEHHLPIVAVVSEVLLLCHGFEAVPKFVLVGPENNWFHREAAKRTENQREKPSQKL